MGHHFHRLLLISLSTQRRAIIRSRSSGAASISGLMIAVGRGDLDSSVRTSAEIETDPHTADPHDAPGEYDAVFGLGAATASFDGGMTGAISAVDWIGVRLATESAGSGACSRGRFFGPYQ